MTSSGKTYLSNSLCISALRQMKTVRYIRANTLMLELDLNKCRDLFEVIDGRNGRRSTIIISQFPIKSWFDLFKEHTYADACLARITDKRHRYRLEMNGISMRVKLKNR